MRGHGHNFISYDLYDMELLLRKHIKNKHTNENTTSKMKKTVKTDNNDDKDEFLIDKGQGFMDRNIFQSTETDFNRLGPVYVAEMKFDEI